MKYSTVPVCLLKLTLLLALSGSAATTYGQGILYPRPEVREQPFYVRDLQVRTTIRDAIAETTVQQTFVNTSSVEQEGTYLYPIPEGAAPSAFSMTVGERTYEPRILTKEEARGIYESIVRRRRDPALLEYVDRNLVRVSVYPIPAHGERVIRLRYSEVLKPSGSARKYSYSLSTARFGARPVGATSVQISLKTTAPIKNVYSPTHEFSIRRPDERTATASWEGHNDASDRDLTLYYSTGDEDVGLSLLTYKTGERDGYFLLLAAPRVSIPKERILPKQVVFVLDRTGSMAGEKIKQARKSLLFCLNSLHPNDRFDVITFNESPDVLMKALEPATQENVARARRFVQDIEASGGTNIDEALRAALDLLRKENGTQKMIVFLTDGQPTVGVTDIPTILRHFKDRNGATEATDSRPVGIRTAGFEAAAQRAAGVQARIFCFGLGYDVNVPFLDRLSDLGRGDADYIKPEEDVEVKVSSFFSKVTSPILAELSLAFDGADVYDIYPKALPDLFKGSQLVIAGRYRGDAPGAVRLAGLAGGRKETFRLAANFGGEASSAFVLRIWAARKIGYLTDQLRTAPTGTGRQELTDEIIRLSREFGIITEYTSFLVDDRELTRLGMNTHSTFETNDRIRKEVAERIQAYGAAGEGATNQSLRSKDLGKTDQALSRYQTPNGSVNGINDVLLAEKKQSRSLDEQNRLTAGKGNLYARRAGGLAPGQLAAGVNRPLDAAEANVVLVQGIRDRTFYRNSANVWQDNSYDEKRQKLIKVQAFSDAHFALLKSRPELAAYSSVGEEVILRIGKNAVYIGKSGKEKLTSAELKELTTR